MGESENVQTGRKEVRGLRGSLAGNHRRNGSGAALGPLCAEMGHLGLHSSDTTLSPDKRRQSSRVDQRLRSPRHAQGYGFNGNNMPVLQGVLHTSRVLATYTEVVTTTDRKFLVRSGQAACLLLPTA